MDRQIGGNSAPRPTKISEQLSERFGLRAFEFGSDPQKVEDQFQLGKKM
jgi:hypothetical protein